MTTKTLPPGCKCQPYDWAGVGEILPVCDEYIDTGCGELCYDCSHNPECHTEADSGELDTEQSESKMTYHYDEVLEAVVDSAGRIFYEAEDSELDNTDVDGLNSVIRLLLHRLAQVVKNAPEVVQALSVTILRQEKKIVYLEERLMDSERG